MHIIKKLSSISKMNSIKSIYIPRMSSFIDEEYIKCEFNYLGIGMVSRVDFTELNKTPGFHRMSSDTQEYKSAFVHFKYLYYNEFTVNILDSFEKGKPAHIYPDLYKREFWILLPAKNPVPETMMNIHQVVENCRILEERIKVLEEKNELLTEKVNNVLSSQRIGEWKPYYCYYNYNQDVPVPAPLTVNDLDPRYDEQEVFDMEEEKEEEESVSTHSSMPSLISSGSDERIKNSYDLCGND